MAEMDFRIRRLGEGRFESPIRLSYRRGDYQANYVSDSERIAYQLDVPGDPNDPRLWLEKAGPRERVYFDPAQVHAAVVTCGGLCPGLNTVIRAIVMCLWYRYGVRRITGFRFGYRGLLPEAPFGAIALTPEDVEEIHAMGGTILGSSRGYGDQTDRIVDTLAKYNVSLLFTIGGDGTQRGALNIANEALSRGLDLAVVGVPKTIDNDLSFVERSFGFETAVAKAVEAVTGAHVEAHDAIRGVGLVKVMGRQSGFIAAHAALASNEANFVLVPEVPFELDGPNGLLAHLAKRLDERNHAVIVVAEGAGQDLLDRQNATDASGNVRLADIGLFLKARIEAHFADDPREINVKYIDPSYIIRSMPADPSDSIYCARLGTNAVHAAMAGRTGMIVSQMYGQLVHVPIQMAVSRRNAIDPDGALWRDVLESTGQPELMVNSHNPAIHGG